jgi:haloacetate dehalogenase
MCEDYRAGATRDHELDEADRGTRKIQCPILPLSAAQDELEEWFDVVEVWRRWADDVQGRGLDSGHFLAEERPVETTEELLRFLRDE